MLILVSFNATASKNNSKNYYLKSFNFKLYYTEGGEKLANEIITQAENNLESMENFLGTRMVEQIDIFLSEKPFDRNQSALQRNGRINLDNSTIFLTYSGATAEVMLQLKKQLAEILINGMLYGNTVKERLKNNREINVPNWYVSGLARYVAGGNLPDISWMADYYEGKLKLNLNLTSHEELAEFGHAIFLHISDSFGISKLRQLLFYTKLSGKTEFAFQYVFNKSLNQLLSDWYKLSKQNYLTDNLTRLPNDPESIGKKLKSANIIDMQFNFDATQLDFLVKTEFGIQIWNYDINTRKTINRFSFNSIQQDNMWAFVKTGEAYLLSQSNGIQTKLFKIVNGKISKTVLLDFTYIKSIKTHPVSGISFLGQKKYRTDIYCIPINLTGAIINLTNSASEEFDFMFYNDTILYFAAFANKTYCVFKQGSELPVYKSMEPVYKLSGYIYPYLSFVQKNPFGNYGMLVNPNDTLEKFRVTNYNRSIIHYDFNRSSQKVLEGIKYGNVNYVVISDASLDKAKMNFIEKEIDRNYLEHHSFAEEDTIKSSYKFITGFEYKIVKEPIRKTEKTEGQVEAVKIKYYSAPVKEFKTDFIRLGFTNTTFNTPLFASFYPVRQGLNNGPNIMVGAGVYDIDKKYFIKGNIRQPITGKGTDFDFSILTYQRNRTWSIHFFNSNYQKEIYNQLNRFTIRQVNLNTEFKWNPKLNLLVSVGYRVDQSIPLSESESNLKRDFVQLQQPFVNLGFKTQILSKSKLNYRHKLFTSGIISSFKPLNLNGLNTNIYFKIKQEQLFYRIFTLSSEIHTQSSIGQKKTVFLMGGSTNWLRPVFANAPVYNPEKVIMYSAITDFPGLPYNYMAGSSATVGKITLSFPLNPILSQQNFNQNIFKFLTIRSYGNIGTAWFGRNPFAITNPDNQDVIETGSMTITNYSAKNPLVWSWGGGLNSILFGYELGVDFALGYNERGKIGRFTYVTVGKTFN